MARILVVDDEEGIRSFLAECLETEGHELVQAADGQEAADQLDRRSFHLLITDLRMPRMDGMSLLRKARSERPEMEVIVLTAHGSVAGAVEAMKLGAFDYLQKPPSGPAEVRLLAQRALERQGLRALKDRSQRDESSPPLTHGAEALKPVTLAIEKVAPTQATVLLLGETGTGKEVVARAIHRLSQRSEGPFVAVNCAALSESLLESELFGHEKGAFTGAVGRRRGRIELADGGTFFLDEVAELKPELQAKLLRVLEEKRFERVGGSRTLEADVRWISATNRDLEARIGQGRFREDLYHRLAVFSIEIPPLRERREDILPIAEHLLSRLARELGRPSLELGPETREELLTRPWSGNVRELANALEKAAILAEGSRVSLESHHRIGGRKETTREPQTLDEMERDAIESALRRSGGHRKRAAEELGIGLRTLYEKLKRYEIG